MPDPKNYSEKSKYMKDCLHQTIHVEKKKRDQGLAQCLNMWKQKHQAYKIASAFLAGEIADSDNLIERIKQWKKGQALIRVSLEELLKIVKDKRVISEQKVEGQTGIVEFSKGKTKLGLADGTMYEDLPVLNEIKETLKSKAIKQAVIIGEVAGYEDKKVVPLGKGDVIHWFPYQILEIEGINFDISDFKKYKQTGHQLKKIFSGCKYIHPVEDFNDVQESWDKLILKDKNKGIIVHTEDDKAYTCSRDKALETN